MWIPDPHAPYSYVRNNSNSSKLTYLVSASRVSVQDSPLLANLVAASSPSRTYEPRLDIPCNDPVALSRAIPPYLNTGGHPSNSRTQLPRTQLPRSPGEGPLLARVRSTALLSSSDRVRLSASTVTPFVKIIRTQAIAKSCPPRCLESSCSLGRSGS